MVLLRITNKSARCGSRFPYECAPSFWSGNIRSMSSLPQSVSHPDSVLQEGMMKESLATSFQRAELWSKISRMSQSFTLPVLSLSATGLSERVSM